MSAPLTNSPLRSVPEWRKRSNLSNDYAGSSFPKRPRYNYYYILASESSPSEDEGSESVDSIQDRETDYCRDTSDTDSKSEESDMSVEYEIVSSSDNDDHLIADRSSSGEGVLIAASAVAASIVNESDIELWATEDDDNDETDSANSLIGAQLFNCQTCRMCKVRKTVSCFNLCSHCYQIRKTAYPPRPRRTHRKKKPRSSSTHAHKNQIQPAPVTKDRLSACLNVLASQDSGLASSTQESMSCKSSQETSTCSSQELQTLAWDKVVVPKNLIQKSYTKTDTSSCSTLPILTSKDPLPQEPISSDCYYASHPTLESWASAASEMCIMCNEHPKNGIFVHSTGGHMCCCYTCAVKFWSKSKRCAWCNLKAKNVIKGFIG
ncbi:hypothetical protein CBL_07592 [Carabus blaptoides fortunei]